MSYVDEERLLPHQIREVYLRAPHEDDGKPARISIDQVLRVKQVVAAAVDGQAPVEYLRAAERFLTAVVAESGTLRGLTALTIEQAWQDLDRLPIVASPSRGDHHGGDPCRQDRSTHHQDQPRGEHP